MKHLPIGISTLSTIIENNMIYVDKTEYVYQLAIQPGRFFLSRPRRFGKSLLLDTLKSLFEGKQDLFQGLAIHDKWDWSQKHPVIKVDFAGGGIHNKADLELRLGEKLSSLERNLDMKLSSVSAPGKFSEIIQTLYTVTGIKAVILIDEYDKPLLDNIEKSREVQDEIREGLRDFYSVIKEQDAHIQFVLLTGVSKFSKVSIFSGINNLKDLSLSPDFAALCGYTEQDLDQCFAEHLVGTDRNLLKIWYNGYNFLGEPVYNPFDILLFISNRQMYRSYWFETGTPTFLMKLFQQRQYFLPELEGMTVGEEILSSFELDRIEPATLLFQTGYLTIKSTDTRRGRQVYTLGFPNFEVKTAFSDYLISTYTDITVDKVRYQDRVFECLNQANLPGLQGFITRLFAGIAHRNFTNNPITQFEGYYASVLYAFFSSIDCTVIAEDISNQGQADLTVLLGDTIYVMEVKVVDKVSGQVAELEKPDARDSGPLKSGDHPLQVKPTPNPALAQIQHRNYAAKYLGTPGKKIIEVGLVFSQAKRNLVQFDWTMNGAQYP